MNYLIPEEILFGLLKTCSNYNYCTKKNNKHCKCRELPTNLPTKQVDTSVVDNYYDYMR
jgi:hypothetical protein